MPRRLFSAFQPSDKSIWKAQMARELHGKFSNIKPWKIHAEVESDAYLTAAEVDKAAAASMQSCQKQIPGWQNMPQVNFSDPWETNANIKHAFDQGANAVLINLGDVELLKCEFSKLLHSIRLSDQPLYFKTKKDPCELFDHIARGAGYYLKGGIAFDPIAEWTRTRAPFAEPISGIAALLGKTKNMKEFRPYMLESPVFYQTGEDAVQELALLISVLVFYADRLTDAGLSPLLVLNRLIFSISIGSQYLTEIAKLRALRFLFRKITRAYNLPDEHCHAFIHANTTLYQAETSPYNNMIRASSEALSSVVGGCDVLTVHYQHAALLDNDDFAGRIARNVSTILMEEAHLGFVSDPAAGSYLIDTLSLKLAESAWVLFLEMEEHGGYVNCFEDDLYKSKFKLS